MSLNKIQNFCCEISTAPKLECLNEYFKSFNSVPESKYEQTVEHSQSEFRNDVKSIDDVKRILGKKWKFQLKKNVYPFLHHLYFTTSNGHIVERPISCFNKKLVDTIGSDTTVRRTRQIMEDLDCIKCVRNSWWFGKKNFTWRGCNSGGYADITSKFDSKAKIYIINRVTVSMLYKICVEMFGKLKYDQQEKVSVSLNDSLEILKSNKINNLKKYYKKVRVGSKLNMDVKPFNVQMNGKKGMEGRRIVQALVNYVVTEKNPFIKHYMNLRKELNENLPERTKGVFELNCHYSASGCHLTKVGIRDYNSCCNLKSHKTKILLKTEEGYKWNLVENDSYKGELFKDVAKEILNTNEIHEYDVKSSVPRVLWLLKNGEWLDNGKDIYEIILGGKFKNSIARDCFKRFCLMALFSSSTDELIRNLKPAFSKSEWKDINAVESIAYVKNRLEKIFGFINDTLVFAHESSIYMEVEKVLQSRGIKYIKKFDCFYTNQPVEDIDSIIHNCAIQYYKKWVLNSSNNNNNNKEEKEEDGKRVEDDNVQIQNFKNVKGITTESHSKLQDEFLQHESDLMNYNRNYKRFAEMNEILF